MCDPRLINLADAVGLDDDIERLIEQNAAHIPWSADSALGVKTRKILQSLMEKYLEGVYGTFPMESMVNVLKQLGVPEAVAESAMLEVGPTLTEKTETLNKALEELRDAKKRADDLVRKMRKRERVTPQWMQDIKKKMEAAREDYQAAQERLGKLVEQYTGNVTEKWLPKPAKAVPKAVPKVTAVPLVDIQRVVITKLYNELDDAAAKAALASLNEWAKDMGVEFAGMWGEGNMASLADSTLDWAREHGGELITQIDDATRDTINQIVARGLENQDGTRGIQKAIEHFIDDDQMTKARAEMIAQTEANNAVSRGAYEANAAVGASEKEWLYYGGACPSGVCPDNEGDGRIPIDDSFSSGHSYPTAHPRCRCVVVYFGVDIDKLRWLGE